MLTKLFYWLRGYLLIRLKGRTPERFFNLCSNHHINLWNIKHIANEYECNISLRDYRKIKSIVKKTKTIPYIKRKVGFPFFLHTYGKRKGYIIGLALFASILYILSLYIWEITILGGHTYTPEYLTKFLNKNHVYVGLEKNHINAQNIEELIRLTYKDIGWVSVEIKGTRLIVRIKETTMPNPAVTRTQNSHIIASKDAIITEIITRTGTPLVQKGSIVKKGDILVSGIVDIVGDNDILVGKKAVIADADIVGKTFYTYKDTFLLNYKDKVYTTNYKKSYMLSIFLKKINIYKPSILYPKYDIIVNDFKLHFNSNFYLPIGYIETKYTEYNEVTKKYTDEEAKQLAEIKLQRYIDKLESSDVIIIENNVKIESNKNHCIAEGRIIVLESIKEFKNISDDEWRNENVDEPNRNDH